MPGNESSHSEEVSPQRDEDIETTFQRLRSEGYSRLDAVRVILDILDVSLSEAKRLLHTSDTWAEALSDTDFDESDPTSSVPPAPG